MYSGWKTDLCMVCVLLIETEEIAPASAHARTVSSGCELSEHVATFVFEVLHARHHACLEERHRFCLALAKSNVMFNIKFLMFRGFLCSVKHL